MRPRTVDARIKRENERLTEARAVKATLESKGWSDICQVVLDRMIADVVGGKVGDKWRAGKLVNARSDEKREFYVGYKQALIDLNNRLWAYVHVIPGLEELIEQLESEGVEEIRPLQDTRYRI